jgi:hypothetical protein
LLRGGTTLGSELVYLLTGCPELVAKISLNALMYFKVGGSKGKTFFALREVTWKHFLSLTGTLNLTILCAAFSVGYYGRRKGRRREQKEEEEEEEGGEEKTNRRHNTTVTYFRVLITN